MAHHTEHAQTQKTDDDKVDRDNIVQQSWDHENQDAGDQRYDGPGS